MMAMEHPEFDDRWLDRLVDGELNESEYRRLLTTLDAHPEGWRRCALAFLESQALGRELAGAGTSGQTGTRLPRPAGQHTSLWTLSAWMTLASAAGFLLALVVAGQVFRPGTASPGTASLTPNGSLASTAGPSALQGNLEPGGTVGVDEPRVAPGQYRLVVHGENGQPQFELPVLAADDPHASFLLNDQAAMPVELIRELRRMGLEVNHQRHWTSVEPNAREVPAAGPVYVPVEELRITPVSSRSFH